MNTASRRLIRHYFALLRRWDRSSPILRMSPDFVQYFEAHLEELVVSGDEPADDVEGAGPVLSLLSTLHPGQALLERVRLDVDRGVRRRGLSCATDILIGLYPTDSFNAQSMAFPEGVLILIHTELMAMLSRMLTVYAIDAQGDPPLAHKQRAGAVADIVRHYMWGTPESDWRLPPLRDRGRLIRYHFLHACEKFALAHEYGHVIAGHVVPGRKVRRRIRVGDLTLAGKTYDQELAADRLGAEILLAGYEPLGQDDEDLMALAGILGAPHFCFSVDHLLNRVNESLARTRRPSMIRDHPPASERKRAISEFWASAVDKTNLPPEVVLLPEAFGVWFDLLERDVVDTIRRAEPGPEGYRI